MVNSWLLHLLSALESAAGGGDGGSSLATGSSLEAEDGAWSLVSYAGASSAPLLLSSSSLRGTPRCNSSTDDGALWTAVTAVLSSFKFAGFKTKSFTIDFAIVRKAQTRKTIAPEVRTCSATACRVGSSPLLGPNVVVNTIPATITALAQTMRRFNSSLCPVIHPRHEKRFPQTTVRAFTGAVRPRGVMAYTTRLIPPELTSRRTRPVQKNLRLYTGRSDSRRDARFMHSIPAVLTTVPKAHRRTPKRGRRDIFPLSRRQATGAE
mmetsp:Transcript_43605/g.132704  ORF Transcript_43605/g.132704 Transcript_43605/m.132704 type:complete len:265 (-) Transcript_43605:197-991(-)